MTETRHARRLVYFILAGWALVGPGLAPLAHAADVGQAVMVRSEVLGTSPGGAARQIQVGEGIGLGLSLATGSASGIRMTFAPQGALTLGPETKLTIDQPVVDQATGRTTSKLALGLGGLRVALGSLFGGDVEVRTPSAVVGIKGTVVYIKVDPSGATTVTVLSGKATAQDLAGGQVVEIPAGSSVAFLPGGAPVRPGAADPALIAMAGEPMLGAGSLPAPPAVRPTQRMTANALGAAGSGRPGGAGATGGASGTGGAAGKGAGSATKGRSPGFAVATTSATALGPAFNDPAVSSFPVSPVLGRTRICNPQTGQCF